MFYLARILPAISNKRMNYQSAVTVTQKDEDKPLHYYYYYYYYFYYY